MLRRVVGRVDNLPQGKLHDQWNTAQNAVNEFKDISFDILDLRTLLPYDKEAVEATVKKTGKVIILHEDTLEGLTALDTFDFWVGTFLIFVLAMFQAILYGWIFGIKRGEIEAHKGAHIRIPKFVQYMLKYIVPVYLLTIFAMFCYDSLWTKDGDGYLQKMMESPVAVYSIGFIATILIFLLILIHIAGLRWKAEGRLDDLDKEPL